MPKADGWVKIHRKILTTELTPSQFKFFVGAILLAKSPKSQNSGLVDLSVRELANELHMSSTEVYRREQELATRGMINQSTKGFIINNYHYYQTGGGVPYTKQLGNKGVSPAERSVPPTKQTVSPAERSVPYLEPKPTPKKIKNNKKIKNIFVPPEWIDKETWVAFLEMRKKKRAIPTEKAKELLIKELEKLKSEGHDPKEVLNQSIMRNYTGVFPLKGGQYGTHRGHSGTRQLPKTYRTPEEIFGNKDG